MEELHEMSAGRGGWGGVGVYLTLHSLILPYFSLMFEWGRVGRPCEETYEMSSGFGGVGRSGVSVY